MLKLFTENKRGRISYFLFLDFLQFDCYDYDSDGSHDFIGTFTTTLADMESQTQGGKEVSSLKLAGVISLWRRRILWGKFEISNILIPNNAYYY